MVLVHTFPEVEQAKDVMDESVGSSLTDYKQILWLFFTWHGTLKRHHKQTVNLEKLQLLFVTILPTNVLTQLALMSHTWIWLWIRFFSKGYVIQINFVKPSLKQEAKYSACLEVFMHWTPSSSSQGLWGTADPTYVPLLVQTRNPVNVLWPITRPLRLCLRK